MAIAGLILPILLVPDSALAAGGGEVARLVIVADSRHLTGLMADWANIYNESSLNFTLMTVALIPTVGVIFGVVADFIMSRIGIDLHSRGIGGH
jgi:hypothetical protein